jgi:hypothetical protein
VKNSTFIFVNLKEIPHSGSSVAELITLQILCVCLFNDALSRSDSIASNVRMTGNELERIWKEVITAYFKVVSRHLPGGTDENHENSQGSLSPGRDLRLRPSEYDVGVLTT